MAYVKSTWPIITTPPIPCAWEQICTRLQALGLLESLTTVKPILDWSKGGSGGPRRVVRPDQKL